MKIFLTGFMGSGKTYWGRKWSQKFNLNFYDLDEVIEREQMKSIVSIFETEGEDRFRAIETACLQSFSGKEDFIVACGGGTACFNNNMQWMNANGITVFLSASPEYIYHRVLEEKEKRPLIKKLDKPELLLYIKQKLKEREPFYKQARMILVVEEIDEESVPLFMPQTQ